MLRRALLCLTTFHIYGVAAEGKCTDFRGQLISHGLHYVPGPDTCTLCVCDNGQAKVCKAVLCSPPQDCRAFRLGTTCCEFICLDDVVAPAEGEGGARAAAGGAAAALLLAAALAAYRVRRRKRRRAPPADEQRSLTSIGYISGSMGYVGGTCETALAGWKPPAHYVPRGEAPPPYDEVVAQCRAERLGNEPPYHRTYPAIEGLVRPDEVMQCSGHVYANIPRPVIQMPNPQSCHNTPLLQVPQAPEARELTHVPMPHHPLYPSVMAFPSAIRLTGSLGAISNRGLLGVLQRAPECAARAPGACSSAPPTAHASLHRTIPRMPAAADAPAPDVRRSFHAPGARRARDAPAGRSMPRSLDRAAAAGDARSVAQLGADLRPARDETPALAAPTAPPAPPAPPVPPAPPQSLPLTVDKPSCGCSYSGEGGAGAAGPGAGGAGGAEDADDYRSECENCKSASSSRWVLQEGWEAERDEGTQTLQRHAPAPAPPPPAAATLPQPGTKQPRTILGAPSNWENWFNTIPDSDTESEEE